jgi:hypothetical protein
MPTPDRVQEMIENCQEILRECVEPTYIPDFQVAAQKQIHLLAPEQATPNAYAHTTAERSPRKHVKEILNNCHVILMEFVEPDYIPDFKAAVVQQLKVLSQSPGTPSFRDIGPKRHGEIVGEQQKG